jgi:polysaccharide export outer membrane protein
MKNLGIVLLGITAAAMLTSCSMTRHTGPKFDARAPKLSVLTNLASVNSTNHIRSEWLQPSTNLFTLGPGDHIDVEMLGDAPIRSAITVGPDGKIYFYLLPGLDVWGLTLTQARQLLETNLTKYVKEPRVSVNLRGVDSQRVWLLGRVQNAGVYPMSGPMTLLEALSLAGGTLNSSASGTTEDLADLTHSFVVREGQTLPIDFDALLRKGDMAQNIYLQPDDFVYMPSSATRDIYVLGGVRQPKTVGFSQGTLVSAIASAGGPIKNAFLSHVAVVRGTLSDPKIAIVDYGAILKGAAPDVRLEPRDIVFVPMSPYRYLSKYADLIVSTFARAVAINEGARAAASNVGPAGVNIGIIQPFGIAPAPVPVSR